MRWAGNPDVILSVDNNAVEFLKRHGNRLFPDVPVVFCGVKSFKDECLDGFDNFTTNSYIFDWTEMDRYGIGASQLPLGSVMINKPFSI